MDIRELTTIKNLAEAYVKGPQVDVNGKNYRVITTPVKPINLSSEEKALAIQEGAKLDKAAAEFRERIKQQTGIDLSLPLKIERTPMTEEEQAAFVQATMDRVMEGDAKFQRLLEYARQCEAEALARQNPLIDTSV